MPRAGVSWAGLAAGPGAWAVNTQLGYSLVPWVCANKLPLNPAIALALALVALAGGLLSWRALRSGRPADAETQGGGHPHDFLAAMSVLTAVLFAAVILTQGAAGLLMHGCER